MSFETTSAKAPTSPHRATATSSNDWWQQSIVRRTIDFVERDLECVISQSPFLASNAASPASNNNSVSSPSSSSSERASPTALFHRCEIVTGELLGKGGFSAVYEITGFELSPAVHERLTADQKAARELMLRTCVDPSTGRGRYAIKHLQRELLQRKKKKNNGQRAPADDAKAALRCARDFSYAASDLAVEACFLSALDHPNVLSLRGLPVDGLRALADGRHDGYFLITDRLQDTLDDRIRDWKQRARLAALDCANNEDRVAAEGGYLQCEKMEYGLQLAEALRYLHDRRCVFRDLKPGNIGFSAAGELKLFDFGLCREVPAAPAGCHLTDLFDMSGVGTRRYMAVEIVNSGRYNCKADVYGWSMVFWEMLTCAKPFALYSVEDHRIAVCQAGERPPLKQDWSGDLRALLRQSWTESVRDRPTMSDVCRSMRSLLLQQQQQQQQQRTAAAARRQDAICSSSKIIEAAPASPTGVMDMQLHFDVFDEGAATAPSRLSPASPSSPDSICHRCVTNGNVITSLSIPMSLEIPSIMGPSLENNNDDDNNSSNIVAITPPPSLSLAQVTTMQRTAAAAAGESR